MVQFVIEPNVILQKAHQLLCLVYSHKELSRFPEPLEENDPFAILERKFLNSSISQLLLEIAVSMRTIDDQWKKIPIADPARQQYDDCFKTQEPTSTFSCFFEDEMVNFRQLCNKIIHSTNIEPSESAGTEAHMYDQAYYHGEEEQNIKYNYYNGKFRIFTEGCGKIEDWTAIFDLAPFIRSVVKIASIPMPEISRKMTPTS